MVARRNMIRSHQPRVCSVRKANLAVEQLFHPHRMRAEHIQHHIAHRSRPGQLHIFLLSHTIVPGAFPFMMKPPSVAFNCKLSTQHPQTGRPMESKSAETAVHVLMGNADCPAVHARKYAFRVYVCKTRLAQMAQPTLHR